MYIPTDADLVLEDTIETSGLGGIYPKGIQIGKIKEIIESIKLDKRRKIVITGGLIELDKKYVQYNELIGEKLNDLDYIYLINKNYVLILWFNNI